MAESPSGAAKQPKSEKQRIPASVGYGRSKGTALLDNLQAVQANVEDSAAWSSLPSALQQARTLLGQLTELEKLQPALLPVDAPVRVLRWFARLSASACAGKLTPRSTRFTTVDTG